MIIYPTTNRVQYKFIKFGDEQPSLLNPNVKTPAPGID